jgi:DNA (cytosine-5)-methyltransferase 1
LIPSVDAIVEQFRCTPRDLRWAIGDLEDSASSSSFMDRPNSPQPHTQRRIDWLFDHDEYDLPDTERPKCHSSKKHTYKAVYGRLRWDRPAPTITGGFDTMGRGRFVHPSRRRTLTPREAARIQFIPGFFDFGAFADRRVALADLIGNAVPPKLSYIFALELLR